jgi:hypothetical protein
MTNTGFSLCSCVILWYMLSMLTMRSTYVFIVLVAFSNEPLEGFLGVQFYLRDADLIVLFVSLVSKLGVVDADVPDHCQINLLILRAKIIKIYHHFTSLLLVGHLYVGARLSLDLYLPLTVFLVVLDLLLLCCLALLFLLWVGWPGCLSFESVFVVTRLLLALSFKRRFLGLFVILVMVFRWMVESWLGTA